MKHLPNPDAIALGPTLGWLTFGCAVTFAAVILLDLDRWRRFWLQTEDPRAIAAFRIAFASVLLININNMWPHFEFLFTDEGLFMTDAARQVLGGKQFEGYGEGVDGEPTGFFDLAAVVHWLLGPRHSVLFFWDSPTAFYVQFAIWEIVTIAFLLGFRTRLAGVVSLVLTLGIMGRNPIYVSGADTVFRVMFVYLVLARSGHAYSIDNWLRCRRLRRAGKLDERGAGSEDLAAIYRRIPAWPRLLIIVQLAVIYLWTGSAKTGHIWARGDSLYYALNLDHFNRVPMQFLGYVFGTNLFRLMTWTVHFWQIGFPLMVLGLIVRWARRERLEPPQGWRRHALRVAWSLLWLGTLAITWVGLPVHLPPKVVPHLQLIRGLTLAGGLLLGVGVAYGWHRLRERPPTFSLRGRTLTLDLERFFAIFFGRRLWLTLGVIFHLHILVLMNIGMFAPVMIVVYVACLNGTEIATLLRRIGLTRGKPITPTEDPTLSHLHHDRRLVPTAVVFAAFMFVTAGVLAKVFGYAWLWWPLLGGIALPLAYMLGTAKRARADVEQTWPWAYGWLGRTFVGTLLAVHIAAVAAHAIPQKDCTASFRKGAQELANPWMRATQTHQSWEMFAPNPSRSNVFMKVYLTDQDGEVWDLGTDANSPRNKATPWLVYDRMGKITRRVTDESPHYQKWMARYHCRKWALEHGGELPRKVEIIKQWYAVPTPEQLREHGPYQPAELLANHGKQKTAYTARCAKEPDAQPSNELRRRHGLPEVPESEIHRAAKPRWPAWVDARG
jgi:hypothetical protein